MRKPGFHLKNGYIVIAIPASGLFIKDGRIVTGHDTPIAVEELILFSRRADAQVHADQNDEYWGRGDSKGLKWKFHVLPVLVDERL